MRNNIKDKNRMKNNVINIVAAIVAFCAILPTIVACNYAWFQADDVNAVCGVEISGFSNRIQYAVDYTVGTWISWGGGWLVTFIQSITSPLFCAEHYQYLYLHIQLMFLVISLVVATFLVVKELFSFFRINDRYAFPFASTLVVLCTSFRDYWQVYLDRYTAMGYVLPLMIGMLSIAVLLLAMRKKNRMLAVVAFILLIANAGCAPQIVFAVCYVLLGICVYDYLREKTVNRYLLIAFVVSVIVGCTNIFAPGNISRMNTMNSPDNQLSMMEVFWVNGKFCWLNLKNMFRDMRSALIVVSMVVWGMLINPKMRLGRTVMFAIYSLLLPYVVFFLVTRGYNTKSLGYMQIRVFFYLDASTFVGLLIGFALICGWIRDKFSNRMEFIKGFAVGIIAVFAIVAVNACVKDPVTPVKIVRNLYHWRIQYRYDQERQICEEIKKSTDRDVVIEAGEKASRVEGSHNHGLLEDSNGYTNSVYATYYGKDSVSIKGWD